MEFSCFEVCKRKVEKRKFKNIHKKKRKFNYIDFFLNNHKTRHV